MGKITLWHLSVVYKVSTDLEKPGLHIRERYKHNLLLLAFLSSFLYFFFPLVTHDNTCDAPETSVFFTKLGKNIISHPLDSILSYYQP